MSDRLSVRFLNREAVPRWQGGTHLARVVRMDVVAATGLINPQVLGLGCLSELRGVTRG
jgi:hypothetical protein